MLHIGRLIRATYWDREPQLHGGQGDTKQRETDEDKRRRKTPQNLVKASTDAV